MDYKITVIDPQKPNTSIISCLWKNKFINSYSYNSQLYIMKYPNKKINWDLKQKSYIYNFTIVKGRYIFENNNYDFYVNFANKHLGGGALNHGWVQEEILTMCLSDLMNFISLKTYDTNLDNTPEIYTTYAYYDWVGNLYANNGSKILDFSPNLIFNEFKLINPTLINWASCAYTKKNKGVPYNNYELNQLFWINVKLYNLIIICGQMQNLKYITIHHGAHGCGAYNHNVHIVYNMQLLSFNFVLNNMKPNIPVNLYWHDLNNIQIKYLLNGNTYYEMLKNLEILAKTNKNYY